MPSTSVFVNHSPLTIILDAAPSKHVFFVVQRLWFKPWIKCSHSLERFWQDTGEAFFPPSSPTKQGQRGRVSPPRRRVEAIMVGSREFEACLQMLSASSVKTQHHVLGGYCPGASVSCRWRWMWRLSRTTIKTGCCICLQCKSLILLPG